MADATGDSAIAEVQDGTLRIFHGKEYRILTNPPSYEKELENAAKYKNATQGQLPVSWSGADRFVRADYFLRYLPQPRGNDAATGYGFMYSALGNVLMPAGLPAPEEDRELTKNLVAALTDPSETYGGAATYFQTISDLTNKHYRFKSLIAPPDVFFDFGGYNFAGGRPVRVIKRIDEYAQQGWSGDIVPHLVEIEGDIYDQAIE